MDGRSAGADSALDGEAAGVLRAREGLADWGLTRTLSPRSETYGTRPTSDPILRNWLALASGNCAIEIGHEPVIVVGPAFLQVHQRWQQS